MMVAYEIDPGDNCPQQRVQKLHLSSGCLMNRLKPYDTDVRVSEDLRFLIDSSVHFPIRLFKLKSLETKDHIFFLVRHSLST